MFFCHNAFMSVAMAEDQKIQWEMSGDQYELFPLPPGPARMLRAILGQTDPSPELLAGAPEAGQQYEIFPELAAALQPKSPSPSDVVDDSSLHMLQEKLAPSVAALRAMLPPDVADATPLFNPPPDMIPGMSLQMGKWDDRT